VEPGVGVGEIDDAADGDDEQAWFEALVTLNEAVVSALRRSVNLLQGL
jgi:hypothetical protein